MDIVTMADPNNKPDFMGQRWYVNADNLLGGWMIANVDKPASEIVGAEEFYICDAITKEVAEHIVELHNHALEHGSP